MPEPRSSIKLTGSRRRGLAKKLLESHQERISGPSQPPDHPVRVVCIADTHNTRPDIPPGDLLVHAGDLTENGSFREVQDGLAWLESQPHRYKILVAGNHDVLLDEKFLEMYPERRYGQGETMDDLEWGDVIYLNDNHTTLNFPTPAANGDSGGGAPGNGTDSRELTIFGSPWTPQYGISAFQYPNTDADRWKVLSCGLSPPDIVVTHGPPRNHLDLQGWRRAGCPYLTREVGHHRPRLVVFGHIHASYGREDAVLDGVQRAYDELMVGWAGWTAIARMVVLSAVAQCRRMVRGPEVGGEKITTFVNAAVVSGPKNELGNSPIVVEI